MVRPKRILVVDDDAEIRTLLREILESLGHEVEEAQDGIAALALIELDIDLVLCDVQMPGMDGYEVVKQIRKNELVQDLPIIMVTGMTSRRDRIRAVEAGANDFIAKPFEFTEIKVRTDSLLRMKEARDALKEHQAHLEGTVQQRTSSLRKALEDVVDSQRQLQQAYHETINRLVTAAEYKDKGTAAHLKRMSRFSALIAEKLKLPPSEIELIKHASPMHDIGKIGTPEEILFKPGKLNGDEWSMMRQHTIIGAHILRNSSSKLLQAGEIIALTHHERWDGKGYPRRLKGEDIPLWGRIAAVADVFDALTSERPYKEAFSNAISFDIIADGAGKHLDSDLVDLLINNLPDIEEIQERTSKEEVITSDGIDTIDLGVYDEG